MTSTSQRLRELAENSSNVRNLSVIAHVDHGKSSLVDSLIAVAGIDQSIKQSDVGKRRATDTRADEKARGITIKSTGVSLLFDLGKDASRPLPPAFDARRPELFCNLIDSPGHADFSAEVTSALRVTDGSLVLVECLDGVSVQTETVLRQSLAELVKPTLVINKLDRMFLEVHYGLEEQYQRYRSIIEDINVQIAMYHNGAQGLEWQVDPVLGNVIFASGYQGWAFSLDTFAQMYASKFKTDAARLRTKLWGDWYFDAERSKWVTTPITSDGRVLQRAFCEFILEPIRQVVETALQAAAKPVRFSKTLARLGIAITTEERQATIDKPKELVRLALQRWLPASVTLRDLILWHLPSPIEAQSYRARQLYSGPEDDATCMAIKRCDPEGPLVFYVSKLVPDGSGHFYAFGRVFSGTLRGGMTCFIPQLSQSRRSTTQDDSTYETAGASSVAAAATSSEPSSSPSEPSELSGAASSSSSSTTTSGPSHKCVRANVPSVYVAMCAKFEATTAVPAGSTAAVLGIDKYLHKTGTILSDPQSFPLTEMTLAVAPVVRCAVSVKNPAHIGKFKEALTRLLRTDASLELTKEESGERVLAATGELHLEIALNDLKAMIPGSEVVVSEPVLSYRETVTDKSPICLAKSSNKHNRIFLTVEPLGAALTEAIEKGNVSTGDDMRSTSRRRQLVDEFGWSPNDASRIWAFGPDETGPNVLVDQTTGAQYLQEIKDSIIASFQWVTKSGVIMGEKLRGVRFNIVDVTVHQDPAHRSGREIIPAMRRASFAAILSAQPRIEEAIARADISVTQQYSPTIHHLMGQKRGVVLDERIREGTALVEMRAEFPFASTFGFNAILRERTSGNAFLHLSFANWAIMASDPCVPETTAGAVVVRRRQYLKFSSARVPPATDFLDRL